MHEHIARSAHLRAMCVCVGVMCVCAWDVFAYLFLIKASKMLDIIKDCTAQWRRNKRVQHV